MPDAPIRDRQGSRRSARMRPRAGAPETAGGRMFGAHCTGRDTAVSRKERARRTSAGSPGCEDASTGKPPLVASPSTPSFSFPVPMARPGSRWTRGRRHAHMRDARTGPTGGSPGDGAAHATDHSLALRAGYRSYPSSQRHARLLRASRQSLGGGPFQTEPSCPDVKDAKAMSAICFLQPPKANRRLDRGVTTCEV